MEHGFFIGHPTAACGPIKLVEYRVNTKQQSISGSLVEGIVYYDCFILENKKNALYYYPTTAATTGVCVMNLNIIPEDMRRGILNLQQYYELNQIMKNKDRYYYWESCRRSNLFLRH